MTLADLVRGWATVPDEVASAMVTGLSLDSRLIAPGNLYVALPGQRAHGAQFAPAARDAGAVAVLTDAAGKDVVAGVLPVVVVGEPRLVMADLAARFHGDPSAHTRMFGITGTNGKTTTTFLVEAALAAAGQRVGTLGTIGFRLAGEPVDVTRTTVTTPESVDLQALLRHYVDGGADAVVMEVSSHALALERVRAVHFDVVGFTQLGRDHLDFHPTLEDYFETKARLFDAGRSRHAVVMTADDHGRELARRLRERGEPALTTVGPSPEDDVQMVRTESTADGGTRVVLAGLLGDLDFTIDLPGAHNGRNAALALAMVAAAGVDPQTAITGLAHAQVPGRMQRIDLSGSRPGRSGSPTVFVDFAHTPQAIAEAVTVGDRFARTAVVVGAGGDRDRAKRGPMGEASGAACELVVVTDDNPRTEVAAEIREAVRLGAEQAADRARAAGLTREVRLIADRQQAIEAALRWAGPDDAVLVLGKGHEQGQIVGEEVRPFDDAEAVRRAWAAIVGEATSTQATSTEAGTTTGESA